MGVPIASATWRLAGRVKELEAFRQVWGRQQCQVVVIAGPAGVGKSRLAEECLARLIADGWKGARATATKAAATVPLGAIAHLIPRGVDLSDPVDGFTRVADVLADRHRKHQRVVLIDDLHLLDGTSAVLIRQLLDAGVVRLLGTMRAGEALGEAVRALTVGGGAHRIDLVPFDEEQVQQVLQAALGLPIGRRTLHAVHTASGGNALYLRELVYGALAAGALTSDGELWEISEGSLHSTPKLTELISARLASAEPAAREVLEVLALCEPLSLADAAELAPSSMLIVLEDSGLIRVHQDRRRTILTLGHPLYGEWLRAKLSTLRRRQLLLAQSERTSAYGARRREDALHLAAWRLAATGTADPYLLIQAATLARHAHDNDMVVTLLQALPEEFHTFATRLQLAEALWEVGDPERAHIILRSSDSPAESEHERLTVMFMICMNRFLGANRADQALAAVDKARPRVHSDAGRRALDVTEGWIRSVSGELLKGSALLEQLEPEVEQAAEPTIWTMAAAIKTFVLAAVGRAEEGVVWSEHSYATHLRLDQEMLMPHPSAQFSSMIMALAEAGHLNRARAVGERAYTDMIAARQPFAIAYLAFYLGRLEYMAGHLPAARRWYAEALRLASEAHHAALQQLALSGLAATAATLGDLATAERAEADAAVSQKLGFLAGEERLGEAWLKVAQGNIRQAVEVIDQAVTNAHASGHIASEMLLLVDLARLGHAQRVASRLAALANQSQGTLALARARFVSALATNDPRELSVSSSELEAIGAYLLAAEAAAQAANVHHQRGDQRRATASTNESARLASHCGGARTPLLAAPEAVTKLTRREREISLLAAAGYPSKNIAENLHLSVRTVDNHLQHAYTKLGVTTRQELASTLGVKSKHKNWTENTTI
ncbi:LuxR C-terminal-related transcriptional regulator [Streptomyces sp900105245]|uniref:LuxR C-terminal-related transcriptional regulator n=1 Tax=Streptomyces sp. 900105245 TaxID=3154379 RepID=A0ABV1UI69_9ACTN